MGRFFVLFVRPFAWARTLVRGATIRFARVSWVVLRPVRVILVFAVKPFRVVLPKAVVLARPVEWIGEGMIWGGKTAVRIVAWPLRKVWNFLPFRKNMTTRRRNRNILAIVFVLAGISLVVVEPRAWNYPYDYIQPRVWNLVMQVSERTGQPVIQNWVERFGLTKIESKGFLLGLDLQGGTELVYEADLGGVRAEDQKAALESLRNVIEQRVNAFGVREPQVQLESSGSTNRLLVELAGIKDVNQAITSIGKTPFLEFREERSQEELDAFKIGPDGQPLSDEIFQRPEVLFKPTKLTGQYLTRAELTFDPTTNQPTVSLVFNDEGKEIFRELTAQNIGKPVAIYLDGYPISAPRVEQEIPSGQAVITGNFSIPEGQELVRNLNAGALPVPINLISQQSVGATLGQESLDNIVKAGMFAFMMVIVFMVFIFRIPGILAVIALCIYTVLSLAIFKLVPVTFTLPGIAGFILSVGMAVDANILIFARMREERRWGRSVEESIEAGFVRAWPSIRDSNVATFITTAILYFLTTSFVRGFALTLGIGVLISMLSAVFISRLLLLSIVHTRLAKFKSLW